MTVLIWKGYEINGNTFYTIDQDQKSTNQNSGVRFDATTERGKDTYYGYIVDIWELDYGLKAGIGTGSWHQPGLKGPLVPVRATNRDQCS